MRRLLAVFALLVSLSGMALAVPPSAVAAAALLESRVLIDTPSDGAEVARGDKVPLTGRLELRRADGTWAPAEGTTVSVYGNVSDNSYHYGPTLQVTGGRFSGEVTPMNGRVERFRVAFAGDAEHAADTREFTVTLSAKTWFYFFEVDAPIDIGQEDLDVVTIDGSVWWSPDLTMSSWYGLTGRRIGLDFKAAGTTTWKRYGTVVTDREGRFHYTTKVRTPGHWRASYPGEEGYLPATSGTGYAGNGWDTKITGFNMSPEPVRKGGTLTSRGRLLRWTGSKWVPIGRASVKLLFQARGSRTWRDVRTFVADRQGWFTVRGAASKDGTWRVRYPGSLTFKPRLQGTVTKGDYVDVR